MSAKASGVTTVSVSRVEAKQQPAQKAGKPEHWEDARGSKFKNPWNSFRQFGGFDSFSLFGEVIRNYPETPKDLNEQLPVVKPTWGEGLAGSNSKIKATWLGHACFLVELPARSSDTKGPVRGARILFDPVFSDRCAPSQHIGPKRYTKTPCKVKDIPEVDAVVISHNHYDHLDTYTITELNKQARPPHFFAPLGIGAYFQSLKIPKERIHILDWWESRRVLVELPASSPPASSESSPSTTTKLEFDLTCTPAQHFGARGLFDRFKTLWAGWAVEEIVNTTTATRGAKAYFAGDTGYRSVSNEKEEVKMPVCPAFKEIGERFGGFDFAMIPIGAYAPRWFMSPIHCAPVDSVHLFQDVKARKALGMHWGAWKLTFEPVLEPRSLLEEELKKAGIDKDAFFTCNIGETVLFDVESS